MKANKVTIVGAGLMGRLLAWRLARSGRQVTVYEQASEDAPMAAAWTAAGMIAPWAERPVTDAKLFELSCLSLALWPALLRELSEDSTVPVRLGQEGSLLVVHPNDRNELLHYEQAMRHADLWDSAVLQPVQGEQLQALEPALNPQLQQGLWLRHESHIDNRALFRALQQGAQHYGAQFHFNQPITDLLALAASGLCLDCRGAWAQQQWPQLRSVRGEVLRIDSQDVQISRPVRLLHPRYHLYLVPKGQQNGHYRYVLGATEIDSSDRSPVSVRSALELLSTLYALSPALAEARIASFEVNCRPALPNHHPDIQPFGAHGLGINGLFRHGFLMAPALLERLQRQHGLPLYLPAVNPYLAAPPDVIKEATDAFVD